MIRTKRLAAIALVLVSCAAVWARPPAFPPELGPNLVAASAGGQVIQASSESSPNDARYLIDESLAPGLHWEPIWSAGRPYWVLLSLSEPAVVSTIVFAGVPEDGDGGKPARIAVALGLDSSDDLTDAGRYELKNEELQIVKLTKPAKARFILITIEADYGNMGGEIGEIGVFGRAVPSGFAGLEGSDALYLRDGSRLAGSAGIQTVEIVTFGQKIMIPAAEILWAEFGQEEGRLDRVALRNGDTIPGIIAGQKISFKLDIGVTLDLPRERIAAIGYKLKEATPAKVGSLILSLSSGDRLSGRILGDRLSLLSPIGPITIPTKDVDSIRSGESAGLIIVTLRNGDEVRAYPSDEALRIGLDIGPTVNLHASTIRSLERVK